MLYILLSFFSNFVLSELQYLLYHWQPTMPQNIPGVNTGTCIHVYMHIIIRSAHPIMPNLLLSSLCFDCHVNIWLLLDKVEIFMQTVQ